MNEEQGQAIAALLYTQIRDNWSWSGSGIEFPDEPEIYSDCWEWTGSMEFKVGPYLGEMIVIYRVSPPDTPSHLRWERTEFHQLIETQPKPLRYWLMSVVEPGSNNLIWVQERWEWFDA